jgi:hypothetical protein
VPPQVRRKALALIAACLKPGGVAVLSYYAGGLGLMRAELNRMVRAAAPADLPMEARLDAAKAFLAEAAGQFQRGDAGLPAQTAQLTAAYTDRQTLMHESLCEAMTALHTTDLQTALEAGGLGFLSYLLGMPHGGLETGRRRAVGADIFDFAWGGYRYGLFGRPPAEGPPRPELAHGWMTVLSRQPGAPAFPAPADYRASSGGVRVSSPLVQAVLDAMRAGPVRRGALQADVLRRLGGAGLAAPPDAGALIDGELQNLWRAGGAWPLWLGAAG